MQGTRGSRAEGESERWFGQRQPEEPTGLLRFGTRPEPIVYHRSDAVCCPRRVLCRRLCISSKYAAAAAAAAARSVRH